MRCRLQFLTNLLEHIVFKARIYFFPQASKNCKPILIPMSMMNGQRMIVEADSASTVQELTHQICHKAGLRDASGFSIYITLTQRVSE